MIFAEPLRLRQRPNGLGLGAKYRKPARLIGLDTETVAGAPYTAQYATSDGLRGLDECHGRPELVRAMLAGFLEEASPGDFLLGGFFYFRFDIQVLFKDKLEIFTGLGNVDLIDEHGIHWKGSVQWPVIFLIGRYKKRTFLIIDCWRFFPGSLAGVCRALGLPFSKMERPPCIAENREPRDDEKEYFNEYALVDADACLEILRRIDGIWAKEALGPCISVAHMAGRLFRRDYTSNVGLDVPDERGQELGLLAYKGGRNSLVADQLPLIIEDCRMYDVRSLYPYVCSEILPSFFGGRWAWSMSPILQGPGIYLLEATLTEGDCYPYRLLMDAKGEYLLPGAISTVQTGYEILAALKHGMLKDWSVQGMVWEPGPESFHPFRAYYSRVFAEKESFRGKNETLYQYYKNLANCLTGKFASTIPMEEAKDVVLDGRLVQEIRRIRVPGLLYNPAVGGFITAAGRVLLFEFEMQSKSVHGATDSLVVPPWGVPPTEGPEMGNWELAAQGTFIAARNKLYAFLGPKIYGNYTGWTDKTGKPCKQGLDAKYPVYKGQQIPKYALHAFKGSIFQFLDAVLSGKRTYSYDRMVQIRESRKRKNLKPLQMNTFVEELKFGGKYFLSAKTQGPS